MQNGKDIQRRIQSVRSTQQITKAMKMVSAAKLTRTQRAALGFRAYAAQFGAVVGRLAAAGEITAPLLARREVKKVAILVVTGKRGLAGGFHLMLVKRALEAAGQFPGCQVRFLTVGQRGTILLRARGSEAAEEFPAAGDVPAYADAQAIANRLSTLFAQEEYDRIDAVYQAFLSPGRQEPTCRTLLPLPLPEAASGEYLCEEGAAALLASLLPDCLTQQVYQILLESKAGEHVARMMAMSAATDNAGDMIADLSLSYNRFRQAAITREISEIVGGAAAQD
ncbi:MAG: ATP synthase F1 subunit gamma [Oscillibacter sp.]